MSKIQSWFSGWWPVFAAAMPLVTGGILWWAAGYFVTRAEHSNTIRELRNERANDISQSKAESDARWRAHLELSEQLFQRVNDKIVVNERAIAQMSSMWMRESDENRAAHAQVLTMLGVIREEIAALKAERRTASESKP
jgi:hypothetical protein